MGWMWTGEVMKDVSKMYDVKNPGPIMLVYGNHTSKGLGRSRGVEGQKMYSGAQNAMRGIDICV
jgi:hypothetical protein